MEKYKYTIKRMPRLKQSRKAPFVRRDRLVYCEQLPLISLRVAKGTGRTTGRTARIPLTRSRLLAGLRAPQVQQRTNKKEGRTRAEYQRSIARRTFRVTFRTSTPSSHLATPSSSFSCFLSFLFFFLFFFCSVSPFCNYSLPLSASLLRS